MEPIAATPGLVSGPGSPRAPRPAPLLDREELDRARRDAAGRRRRARPPPRRHQPGRWIAAAAVLVVVLVGWPDTSSAGRRRATPRPGIRRSRRSRRRSRSCGGCRSSTRCRCGTSTDAAFRKRVGVDLPKLTPAAKRRIENLEGTLRALGLIDAKTDLVKSFDTVNQAGVLAFYDPDARRSSSADGPARHRAEGDARARADPRAPGPALRPPEAASCCGRLGRPRRVARSPR